MHADLLRANTASLERLGEQRTSMNESLAQNDHFYEQINDDDDIGLVTVNLSLITVMSSSKSFFQN